VGVDEVECGYDGPEYHPHDSVFPHNFSNLEHENENIEWGTHSRPKKKSGQNQPYLII
jgi:hypothetical protein